MRSERQAQLGVREHVGAVGERDGEQPSLLDEQDRDPVVAHLPERLEEGLDDARREPERGLVEEQHVRPRDQRARDRELLLLAAGEQPGLAAGELRDDREERPAPSRDPPRPRRVSAVPRGPGEGSPRR